MLASLGGCVGGRGAGALRSGALGRLLRQLAAQGGEAGSAAPDAPSCSYATDAPGAHPAQNRPRR